jgi:hypothetical protein
MGIILEHPLESGGCLNGLYVHELEYRTRIAGADISKERCRSMKAQQAVIEIVDEEAASALKAKDARASGLRGYCPLERRRRR